MRQKLIRDLEFNTILAQVSEYAATDTVKQSIHEISMTVREDVLIAQHMTVKEAYECSCTYGRLPIKGYRECMDFVLHAQKGGLLREGALLQIAADLRIVKQAKRYIFHENRHNISFDRLEEISSELESLSALEKKITEAIISEDEISDHASPELYQIRRKIRDANASVKDKLNRMIQSSQYKQYLQDAIVTIRNGRYVLPVKNEYRAKINGIVHDSSGSGLTLFIEPMPIVQLNNQLRELESLEKKEIERILHQFSDMVGEQSLYLSNNERIILQLDDIFARAEYALVNGHTMPQFTKEREMYLHQAFHPLIPKDMVVASDIEISNGFTQVVITGPNTGGKTVTLKTIGLCCMMAQCGLFIPCKNESIVCLFDDIYTDIGDEQSISQNLSTFSSHMTNIIEILKHADESSLVLLDELGAGTDPSEGASLAWAILSEIKTRGTLSLATTHYNEIKQYALLTEGVLNASVEFDVENLRPTYRLLMGIPGKSNAFEISKRLGLDQTILDAAGRVLSRGNEEYESILMQLQQKLHTASESADEARALETKNQALAEKLDAKEQEWNERKDRILTDAALEAKQLIQDAKRKAKEMMAEADRYVKLQDKESIDQKEKIGRIAKETLEQLNKKIPEHRLQQVDEDDQKKYTFKKSDEVTIPDLNADGVIISLHGEDALVQVGVIKTKMPLSKLRPKKRKKEKQQSYSGGMKAMSVSSSLDIRGITATEVLIELEKFLDDALLAHLSMVTIVHGKGSGVLRKAVADVLNHHPNVVKYRVGGLNEGGEGATIAYLE